MSDQERAEKLREAQRLIGEVHQTLDRRVTCCGGCTRPQYINWTHHQLSEALQGTLTKLERCVGSLETPAARGEERAS